MGNLDFSLKITVKKGKHVWPVIVTGIPFDTFKVSSTPLKVWPLNGLKFICSDNFTCNSAAVRRENILKSENL